MSPLRDRPLTAAVLTVSDGVAAGVRDDASGRALVDALEGSGYEVVAHEVTPDGTDEVETALRSLLGRVGDGLILTTGGTGFGPRDLTPEGTRRVIERDAPGLAEAARLVNPLGRLSRGVAGAVGTTLIVNLPGSTKGAVECFEAVADVIPHALRLLSGETTTH